MYDYSEVDEGIKLLWNGKFAAAERLFDSKRAEIPRYALHHAESLLIRSFITASEHEATRAFEELQQVRDFAAQQAKIIAANQTPDIQKLSEIQRKNMYLDNRVVVGDSSYLIAVLQLFRGERIKAGYNLRKSWKVFESCLKLVEEAGAKPLSRKPSFIFHEEELTAPPPATTPSSTTALELSSQATPEVATSEPAHIPKDTASSPNEPAFEDVDLALSSPLSKSPPIERQFSSPTVAVSSFDDGEGELAAMETVIEHQREKVYYSPALVDSVRFGVGLFLYVTSVLPPTLLRLSELVGFRADRGQGLRYVLEVHADADRGGVGSIWRAPFAALVLVHHGLLSPRPPGGPRGANDEALLDEADQVLDQDLRRFPTSSLFLLIKAIVARRSGRLDDGIALCRRALEVGSLADLRSSPLVVRYELANCLMMRLSWGDAAAAYAPLIQEERFFLRTQTALKLGACYAAVGDKDNSTKMFELVQGFAAHAAKAAVGVADDDVVASYVHMAKRYLASVGLAALSAFELMYLRGELVRLPRAKLMEALNAVEQAGDMFDMRLTPAEMSEKLEKQMQSKLQSFQKAPANTTKQKTGLKLAVKWNSFSASLKEKFGASPKKGATPLAATSAGREYEIEVERERLRREAARDFEQYLEARGAYLLLKGALTKAAGASDDAVACFSDVISMKEKLKEKFVVAYALFELGDCLYERGETLRAADTFHRCAKLSGYEYEDPLRQRLRLALAIVDSAAAAEQGHSPPVTRASTARELAAVSMAMEAAVALRPSRTGENKERENISRVMQWATEWSRKIKTEMSVVAAPAAVDDDLPPIEALPFELEPSVSPVSTPENPEELTPSMDIERAASPLLKSGDSMSDCAELSDSDAALSPPPSTQRSTFALSDDEETEHENDEHYARARWNSAAHAYTAMAAALSPMNMNENDESRTTTVHSDTLLHQHIGPQTTPPTPVTYSMPTARKRHTLLDDDDEMFFPSRTKILSEQLSEVTESPLRSSTRGFNASSPEDAVGFLTPRRHKIVQDESTEEIALTPPTTRNAIKINFHFSEDAQAAAAPSREKAATFLEDDELSTITL